MRTGILLLAAIVASIVSVINAQRERSSKLTPQARHTLQWYRLQASLLDEEANGLLHSITKDESTLQQQFLETRRAYKRLELFVEFFNPATARALNGPNLPDAEADNKDVVIVPEGFQVIEEMIFPHVSAKDTGEVRKETLRLISSINRVKATSGTLTVTDAQLFDAMRQEILRITALGITGFDSPVAKLSLAEAKESLTGIKATWLFYVDGIESRNPGLADHTRLLFTDAQHMLDTSKDFDSFSRMDFIKNFLNPLSVNLKLSREALGIAYTKEAHFLDPAASNAFAKEAFNPMYFSPDQSERWKLEDAQLGKKLFYDPVLSGNGTRSCASCHNPAKAFTDGLVSPASLNPEHPVIRNTPTLLNAALQPGLFYDMRVAYLEDQVTQVVQDPSEMHGSLKLAVDKLAADSIYRKLFNGNITEQHIRKSIAAYVRSLVQLDSRFDQYMRGDESRMDVAEVRGFNLFMGKAKCATCHFVPLFNGTVPPDFVKMDAEVLGVPSLQNGRQLDSDEGKYNLYRMAHQRFAFKTPTLRNVENTAPYMHNGVFKTLEEVMEFYNNGGGAGIGISLENQTLPTDSLHLSKAEQQEIIAFMKTLNSEPGR